MLHTAPAEQSEHVPEPSHESPPPQPTPIGSELVTMHTAAPLEQSIAPSVHGLPVLQSAIGMHALHMPVAPHVPPMPHGIPGGSVVVDGKQTGLPEPQSIVPLVHGSPVLHTAPGTQTLQLPAPSHCKPGPHVEPAGRITPVSVQSTGLQCCTPT